MFLVILGYYEVLNTMKEFIRPTGYIEPCFSYICST